MKVTTLAFLFGQAPIGFETLQAGAFLQVGDIDVFFLQSKVLCS